MAVLIEFDTVNAAFADDGKAEVARILREIADTVEATPRNTFTTAIRDVNGNRVGYFGVHLEANE